LEYDKGRRVREVLGRGGRDGKTEREKGNWASSSPYAISGFM
jgi:hypothetical protein